MSNSEDATKTAGAFIPAVIGGLCGAGASVLMTLLQDSPVGVTVAIGSALLVSGIAVASLQIVRRRRWAVFGAFLFVLLGIAFVGWQSWNRFLVRQMAVANFIVSGEAIQVALMKDHSGVMIEKAMNWQNEAIRFVNDNYGPIQATMLTSPTGIAADIIRTHAGLSRDESISTTAARTNFSDRVRDLSFVAATRLVLRRLCPLMSRGGWSFRGNKSPFSRPLNLNSNFH